MHMNEFHVDEDEALKILMASQNSIIINDQNILSYENEKLKETSFEDLAK